MPACLGVPRLQDVCMRQFSLHLTQLAISSPKILTQPAPQQESPVKVTEHNVTENSHSSRQQGTQSEEQPSPSGTGSNAKQLDTASEEEQQDGSAPASMSDTPAAPSEAAVAVSEAEAPTQTEPTAEKSSRPAEESGSGSRTRKWLENRLMGANDPGSQRALQPQSNPSTDSPSTEQQDSSGETGGSSKLDSFLEQQREARAYLACNVPPSFFEQLMHSTLSVINKHFYDPKYKSRRGAMVSVTCWLLGDHVRHLSLDTCRMLCDRCAVPHVFDCLRHMPRLQTLAIGRLNFWKIPELSVLPDLLTDLPQLTTLRLEYICLPEMVRGLADKCPRLQELSLKDSEKITDREVAEIRRCLQLKRLNISGTSVTGAGSWEMLCALPALTWFEHCPFNCNSGPFLFDSREAMLSYIWEFLSAEGRAHSAQLPSVTGELALPAADRRRVPEPEAQDPRPAPAQVASRESSVGAEGSGGSGTPSALRGMSPLPLSRSASGSGCGSPRRLRIENFWLFNPKTEEVALCRVCPAVSQLRLDFVFQDMGLSPDVSGLGLMKHVTRLELNSFDAPRFTVVSEVLRQLGGQLTELALHVCDDYTATAALENAAARWCPRLRRYAFTGDYSVRLPAERGDEDLEFTALPRRHPELRELTLGGFVTGRRLLFVLAHADNLQRLRLDGELRYLDDAGFTQLTTANRLRHLEELWINCSAALTVQPLLPLIMDTQSVLRRLGRLSSLQGLDRAAFLELRKQVRALNLALELVWVTPGV